jgi:hypothetical protein
LQSVRVFPDGLQIRPTVSCSTYFCAAAKYKDGELSFTITRERNGQKMTTKYAGKVSGDTIKGSRTQETPLPSTNRNLALRIAADPHHAPCFKTSV